MKNTAGKIVGFILGMGGFLVLYKYLVLDHIPPTDEIAPGMVLIASLISGICFAWLGSLIQNGRKKLL